MRGPRRAQRVRLSGFEPWRALCGRVRRAFDARVLFADVRAELQSLEHLAPLSGSLTALDVSGNALRCAAGIAAFACAHAAAKRVNPVAALWLFGVPYGATTLLGMLGNWSQHVFLRPEAPRSALGMTYTCVNHADNQRTFNDGYHAGHHANGRLHWTELPGSFMASLPAHAAADALVFHGVHFFEVGIAVLLGRSAGLRFLARRYVRVGQPLRDEAALVAELRRRLAPIRIDAAAVAGKHAD